MPPQLADKPGLRSRYRALRKAIGAEQRQRHDLAIAAEIEELCVIHKPSRIAAYLAFDGEPDITAVLGHLAEGGTEVYLPVISSGNGTGELIFRRWHTNGDDADNSQLRRNAFGIREPVAGRRVGVEEIEIILIPLVAWDRRGGRLGMGAGYYDRALAPVADAGVPLRIGIAYSAQRAKSVPMTADDIRLHGVISEQGLFTFGD